MLARMIGTAGRRVNVKCTHWKIRLITLIKNIYIQGCFAHCVETTFGECTDDQWMSGWTGQLIKFIGSDEVRSSKRTPLWAHTQIGKTEGDGPSVPRDHHQGFSSPMAGRNERFPQTVCFSAGRHKVAARGHRCELAGQNVVAVGYDSSGCSDHLPLPQRTKVSLLHSNYFGTNATVFCRRSRKPANKKKRIEILYMPKMKTGSSQSSKLRSWNRKWELFLLI